MKDFERVMACLPSIIALVVEPGGKPPFWAIFRATKDTERIVKTLCDLLPDLAEASKRCLPQLLHDVATDRFQRERTVTTPEELAKEVLQFIADYIEGHEENTTMEDEPQTAMPPLTEPSPPSDQFDTVLHAKDRAAMAIFTSIEALANDGDLTVAKLDSLTHAFARMNETLKDAPDPILSETGVFGTTLSPDDADQALGGAGQMIRNLTADVAQIKASRDHAFTDLDTIENIARGRGFTDSTTVGCIQSMAEALDEARGRLDRLNAMETFYTSVRLAFGMGLNETGPKKQDDPVFLAVVRSLRDSQELGLVREALARSNELKNDRIAAPATAVDLLVKMAAKKADESEFDAARRECVAWRNMHEQFGFVVREEHAKLGIAPRFWLSPEEAAKVVERYADLADTDRAKFAANVAMVRQIVEHYKSMIDSFDALSRGDVRQRKGCEIAGRFRKMFGDLKAANEAREAALAELSSVKAEVKTVRGVLDSTTADLTAVRSMLAEVRNQCEAYKTKLALNVEAREKFDRLMQGLFELWSSWRRSNGIALTFASAVKEVVASALGDDAWSNMAKPAASDNGAIVGARTQDTGNVSELYDTSRKHHPGWSI